MATRRQAYEKAARDGHRKHHRRRKGGKKFIQQAIKRPGALTKAVGGKPGANLGKVKHLATHGTTLQKRQANFYLHVLRKAGR
jgi:hypothetical protein